ncbi:MAG: efflux RND transporter periplasmic adaptor subunit [Treponema sp.]|jgi:multidrug efflux pump subunit AcrA (membrane-fusion protein)|nr:efflux RND transporter periplasmic adaptor subunit [Treponema sp.]
MKKAIIIIAALLVAAGLVFIPSLLAGNGQTAQMPGFPGGGRPPTGGAGGRGSGSGTVFAVRVADAEKRTLQAYIEVNGNIVSEQQVAVVPDAGGKLASMKVSLGAAVQKGALIAEVDPSRPGSAFSLSPVYAPVSGIVISNPLTVGSTVSTGTTLLTISAAGSIEIEALIPEREVGQLRAGLRAEARLEAFPGEVFPAELTQLSPVVDAVSRTKKVTLRFTKEDRRINPGMFARIRLNTRTYPDVISIPQEALVDNRGSVVVYVLDAADNAAGSTADSTAGTTAGNTAGITDGITAATNRVSMREVVTGVTVDSEVEIKSGLTPGEAVVVQGQQFLSNGAPVRVIGRF